MIEQFLSMLSGFIIYYITLYGYAAVFFLMILESAALPVPSEIVMPFAGFIVFQGKFDMLSVVLAGTLGNLIGSIIAYYVGFFGGRPLILKYGKYVLISHKKLHLAEQWFERYGDKTVFISRLLPVIRTFISIPAGAAKMNFKKFFIYTFIGSLPWNFALAYLGFVLGENWKSISFFFEKIDILVIIIIVLAIIYFIFKRRKHAR